MTNKNLGEIYCPECGKPVKRNAVICANCGVQIKVPILLIYPICFLAGMGIMLILACLVSISVWLNGCSLDFNVTFKSWDNLIAFFIGAIFFSGFVLLWYEHIEGRCGIYYPGQHRR